MKQAKVTIFTIFFSFFFNVQVELLTVDSAQWEGWRFDSFYEKAVDVVIWKSKIWNFFDAFDRNQFVAISARKISWGHFRIGSIFWTSADFSQMNKKFRPWNFEEPKNLISCRFFEATALNFIKFCICSDQASICLFKNFGQYEEFWWMH